MIVNLPLRGAWFTTLDGESLRLIRATNWGPDSVTVGGEVRQYGGRRRLIRTKSLVSQIPLPLTKVTEAQLEWLENHAGELLLLRTSAWRRWGSYLQFQSVPRYMDVPMSRQSWAVTLQWTDSDYDESV